MKKKIWLISLTFAFITTYSQEPLPKLGLLESTAERLDSLPERVSVSVPPDAKLDSAKDLSKFFPPAGDQMKQGSCAAFSSAYEYVSYLENLKNPSRFEINGVLEASKVFSPTFVYNTIVNSQVPKRKSCEKGIFFDEALRVIRDKGVPTLSDFAYNGGDSLGCLVPVDKKVKDKAAKHRIAAFEIIPKDLLSIRYNIFSGYPVMVSLDVDTPFVTDGYDHGKEGTPFIWHYNPAKKYGRHAMVCTGYDDNTKLFKILNSWGLTWGQEGYFYMTYEDLKTYAKELYIAYSLDESSVPANRMTSQGKGEPPVIEGEFASWFKVGYYRIYNNLNIGLTFLDKNKLSIIVSFTDRTNGNIVQSLYLNKGDTKKFVYKNRTINFAFTHIGPAGRLPTTAAFFTVNTEPLISVRDTTIELGDVDRICAVHSGGIDRNFGADPIVELSLRLDAVKNSVVIQITANMTEPGGDHTSGNVHFYQQVLRLPENCEIESILSPVEINIPPTQLRNKGENSFSFDQKISPVFLIGLIGDSDDNNNDDLFPGPCVDDKHAQIREIKFYPLKLRYTITQ